MAAAAKRIEIGVRDRAALEAIVGAGTSQARMVARAQIVLEAGEGRAAAQIGRSVGCSANTAQKWRGRFERDAQAAEVCGLYLDPPENTIVVSIDEKTGIQAKGLVREDTRAAPGRPDAHSAATRCSTAFPFLAES